MTFSLETVLLCRLETTQALTSLTSGVKYKVKEQLSPHKKGIIISFLRSLIIPWNLDTALFLCFSLTTEIILKICQSIIKNITKSLINVAENSKLDNVIKLQFQHDQKALKLFICLHGRVNLFYIVYFFLFSEIIRTYARQKRDLHCLRQTFGPVKCFLSPMTNTSGMLTSKQYVLLFLFSLINTNTLVTSFWLTA